MCEQIVSHLVDKMCEKGRKCGTGRLKCDIAEAIKRKKGHPQDIDDIVDDADHVHGGQNPISLCNFHCHEQAHSKPHLPRRHQQLDITMAVTCGDIPRLICSVILPPVGVFFQVGCTKDLAINVLLTILGTNLPLALTPRCIYQKPSFDAQEAHGDDATLSSGIMLLVSLAVTVVTQCSFFAAAFLCQFDKSRRSRRDAQLFHARGALPGGARSVRVCRDHTGLRGETGNQLFMINRDKCELVQFVKVRSSSTESTTAAGVTSTRASNSSTHRDGSSDSEDGDDKNQSGGSNAAQTDKEREQTYYRFRQGESFGELALLMDYRRTGSVRAVSYAEMCILNRENTQKLLFKHPCDHRKVLVATLRESIKNNPLKEIQYSWKSLVSSYPRSSSASNTGNLGAATVVKNHERWAPPSQSQQSTDIEHNDNSPVFGFQLADLRPSSHAEMQQRLQSDDSQHSRQDKPTVKRQRSASNRDSQVKAPFSTSPYQESSESNMSRSQNPKMETTAPQEAASDYQMEAESTPEKSPLDATEAAFGKESSSSKCTRAFWTSSSKWRVWSFASADAVDRAIGRVYGGKRQVSTELSMSSPLSDRAPADTQSPSLPASRVSSMDLSVAGDEAHDLAWRPHAPARIPSGETLLRR
ncbi:Protein ric1, partial [Globisporangium splendens]